ncbi:5-oxoprolinase/urea amidolyase family protein [Arthrobacter sp. Sa2CUA1]|uniref:5-oxoprolinase/urea amidolyase family protein n=1 Tax=Arthrobacter gallicola TaxID=2762225 RepID=A0ABR8UQL1_9MICC|nr:5-oxoprolinase/urea amidolyase family protein [Arthrobacter gallicola]
MPGAGAPSGGWPLRIRQAGSRALLVETADTPAASALHARLLAAPLPGQVEVIPAARTVLIRLAAAAQMRQTADLLAALEPVVAGPGSSFPAAGPLVELDTVYDGEDLAEVARLTGLGSAGAVAAAHSGSVWTAAFCGFVPGFAYLTGGDPGLEVPRRDVPRTRVPAGAVALAGAFSAAYPGPSPGGWQLIGRTSAPLWDLDREAPALIVPGTRVRFRPVRGRVELLSGHGPAEDAGPRPGSADVSVSSGSMPGPLRPAAAGPAAVTTAAPDTAPAAVTAAAPATRPAAVVVYPGPQTTVQDQGRAGYSSIGVGASGAADRSALARANRLAGNHPDAAGLEILFGGLELRAERDLVLALTGADAPLSVLSAGGTERAGLPDVPFLLRAGEVLSLGMPLAGLRSYLAFRGGLNFPPVLGSRATDTLAKLGPEPLAAGTGLSVGADPGAAVGLHEIPPPLPGADAELRYLPGPRQDWFSAAGREAFADQGWRVGTDSNRVGIRFSGDPLPGRRTGELASEAVLPGSIQIPASGLPILFLADAPVTGGYPVIGVVEERDLDLAAQLRPGTTVRFVPVPQLPAPGAGQETGAGPGPGPGQETGAGPGKETEPGN